jgi:hypothetical protein
MYICEFESCMNLNLKYSNIVIICIFQMVSIFGVGLLKLTDTKDSLPHPAQRIFGVSCVMTVDTKKLIFGIGRYQPAPKIVIFYITQRVSDPVTGTKDWLPADTTNCFCSSVWYHLLVSVHCYTKT